MIRSSCRLLRLTTLALALAVPLLVQAADAPVPGEPPRGPRVTVMTVTKGEIVETVVVTGTLVPREEVLIGPEIDGFRVVEVLAEEGDRIEKGQVLARLSRETLDAQVAQNDASIAKTTAAIAQAQNQIAQAQAALRQSRQALQRTTELKKSGFASQAAMDSVVNDERGNQAKLDAAEDWVRVSQAEKQAMEAQRRELLVRLARTEVRSPAAGIVSRRTTKVGAVASMAADPMYRVIAKGEIELEGEVPETRIDKLRVGQAVAIHGGGATAAGRVRLISPEVDRVSRLGKVRVTLIAGDGQRIGTYARGVIETKRVEALNVPASAILYNETKAFVQVVREDRIVSTPVVLGVSADNRVEIVSGLEVGAVVVMRAGSFLRHGDAVTPVREPVRQSSALSIDGQAVR